MSQLNLFPNDLAATNLSPEDGELLRRYAVTRAQSGAAQSTVAGEVSQLRSLARCAPFIDGQAALKTLLEAPEAAAALIEASSYGLSLATVQTRVRAFGRLLMLGVPDRVGRKRTTAFMDAFPKGISRGWHDSGVSLPGARTRQKLGSPTPGPDDLARLLDDASKESALAGAIAAFACYSGLDIANIVEIRWKQLEWSDRGETAYVVASVVHRGRRSNYYLVGPGVPALLRWGLASGLDREAFVFPGRSSGASLSVRGFRERLQRICRAAGWPAGLSRSQLASAFAAWLRQHHLDDHAIKVVLGRRRVASVDHLLRRQDKIEAQYAIDRVMPPQPPLTE